MSLLRLEKKVFLKDGILIFKCLLEVGMGNALNQITNLEELVDLFETYSSCEIEEMSNREYSISKSTMYLEYKKNRSNYLKRKKKWLLLFMHLNIHRFKIVAKVAAKCKGIDLPNTYFEGPFIFGFNENRACLYTENSYDIPSLSYTIECLMIHKEEIKRLNDNIFIDDMSRKTLFNILMYRITRNNNYLFKIQKVEQEAYFDDEIINCNKEEVFVDCGGYTGDTTKKFIQKYKSFKKIYIYEPDRNNIKIAKKTLKKHIATGSTKIFMLGVGEKHDILCFEGAGVSGKTTEKGENRIEIVSLDEHIKESISFLKMDIEGSEMKALQGARLHISIDKPILTVCAYHRINDLWEIPKFVGTLNNSYNYYLRHYSYDYSDTIIYCIPKGREML